MSEATHILNVGLTIETKEMEVGDASSTSDGIINGDGFIVQWCQHHNYAGAARVGMECGSQNNGMERGQQNELNFWTFAFDHENKLPNRPCTAFFTPRGRTHPSEIFEALKACHIK